MPETTTYEPKEGPVSHFSVSCPCGCGEVVTAADAGFSATTVEVSACSKWAANGISSSRLPKSWGYSHAVPTTGIRHRDGLVEF